MATSSLFVEAYALNKEIIALSRACMIARYAIIRSGADMATIEEASCRLFCSLSGRERMNARRWRLFIRWWLSLQLVPEVFYTFILSCYLGGVKQEKDRAVDNYADFVYHSLLLVASDNEWYTKKWG
jgi:hypothetical protein